ncbi:MAG TPA: HlyD family secretion protein [Candidatus Paceibacterota bacterium]
MAINEQTVLQKEEEILAEEKEILAEIKAEERSISRLVQSVWFASAVVVVVILGVAGGAYYLMNASTRISIDKAEVSAPLIPLSPQNARELKNILVHEGDEVQADTVVAQVGNELIKTQTAGRIVLVNSNIGKLFNRGESVVQMVQSDQLRVEARVAEDKGLKDIVVGQRAVFTVDAYGSKEYEGIVDEVSPAPLEAGVAFNISDKRTTKEYVVKIRFDLTRYPELSYGMSARAWVYIK